MEGGGGVEDEARGRVLRRRGEAPHRGARMRSAPTGQGGPAAGGGAKRARGQRAREGPARSVAWHGSGRLRLTRSAAIATATGRPWRRDRVSAPAMCETEGNNPDGSKAHRVFDFARGWARWRAGGGSSTTDQSDGRNSSGGRQWQDRFWRIRPGSSSTRGLGSWKRWRERCSREESRRGCRRWSESTSEGSSVRSEPEEIKEKAACADKAHILFRRHQNLPSTGMARRVSGRSESTTTA